MSCIQPEAILRVAESLAVPKVSNEAAKALAPHIDVRLREIIQVCAQAKHKIRALHSTGKSCINGAAVS